MRTSSPALAAILVGALATTIHAQDVQVQQMIQVSPPDGGQGLSFPPNFMQRPQFKTGSGRMRGRVLQADGSGPVRRAQVRLMSAESGPKSAITDVQGRFDVRDLPAGRYTITANKSGFMPVQYGQTRPFESGKPIELADKQTLDNVDLAMPRGGSISGRILDEFGDPMPDTGITVMRLGWSNGKRRLTRCVATNSSCSAPCRTRFRESTWGSDPAFRLGPARSHALAMRRRSSRARRTRQTRNESR
jgi:hypothetical protein